MSSGAVPSVKQCQFIEKWPPRKRTLAVVNNETECLLYLGVVELVVLQGCQRLQDILSSDKYLLTQNASLHQILQGQNVLEAVCMA